MEEDATMDSTQIDDVIKDFSRAIELNPEDAVAYMERAREYLSRECPDEAVKDLNKACELDPELEGLLPLRDEAEEIRASMDWVRLNERQCLRKLGVWIAEARNHKEALNGTQGVSQRELAERVGTTQTSIRRLENGEANVSISVFVRAAKVLELDNWAEFLDEIQPDETVVNRRFDKFREEIERKTSAMGLRHVGYHEKKALLQLMRLWPR